MEKSRTFRLLVVSREQRRTKQLQSTITEAKRNHIMIRDNATNNISSNLAQLHHFLPIRPKPLTSPNGKIRVEASNTVGQPTLTITYNDAGSSYTLFDNLLTGLKTDRRNLTDSMKLVSVTSPMEIVEEYTMITGKKRDCSNHGFECIQLRKSEGRKVGSRCSHL